MTITLNHTIVPARDKAAAAKFFADIFGLEGGPSSHFAPVRINNGFPAWRLPLAPEIADGAELGALRSPH